MVNMYIHTYDGRSDAPSSATWTATDVFTITSSAAVTVAVPLSVPSSFSFTEVVIHAGTGTDTVTVAVTVLLVRAAMTINRRRQWRGWCRCVVITTRFSSGGAAVVISVWALMTAGRLRRCAITLSASWTMIWRDPSTWTWRPIKQQQQLSLNCSSTVQTSMKNCGSFGSIVLALCRRAWRTVAPLCNLHRQLSLRIEVIKAVMARWQQ